MVVIFISSEVERSRFIIRENEIRLLRSIFIIQTRHDISLIAKIERKFVIRYSAVIRRNNVPAIFHIPPLRQNGSHRCIISRSSLFHRYYNIAGPILTDLRREREKSTERSRSRSLAIRIHWHKIVFVVFINDVTAIVLSLIVARAKKTKKKQSR